MSEKSLKAQLKTARRARRITTICMRGDLTARYQELEDDLQASYSVPTGPSRLSGPEDQTLELAHELEAVRAEMLEASVKFTLEAMGGPRWRALKAEHPVGEDPTPTDLAFGADAKSFFYDAVRRSIVSPEIDDEDWVALVGDPANEESDGILSDADWSKLVDTAYALNEEPVSIPFSSRAYGILRMQSEESESRETSE